MTSSLPEWRRGASANTSSTNGQRSGDLHLGVPKFTNRSTAHSSNSWRPSKNSTSPPLLAPGQGRNKTPNFCIGDFAFLKAEKDIPADCPLHKALRLKNNTGAYDHPCVIAEIRGDNAECFLATSKGDTEITKERYPDASYRAMYRLVQFPGANTHDNLPVYKLSCGRTAKRTYINLTGKYTIPLAVLGNYYRGNTRMEMESVQLLLQEAKTAGGWKLGGAKQMAPRPSLGKRSWNTFEGSQEKHTAPALTETSGNKIPRTLQSAKPRHDKRSKKKAMEITDPAVWKSMTGMDADSFGDLEPVKENEPPVDV
ncbi:MAG: hypothetical protein M1820_006974 [Bogoriella megaspora]|nr:MAG: hypothetical protein M1820_006974 [Bogoriella megaspora]